MDQTRTCVAGERSREEVSPGGHPIEIWISYVLRAGVLVAGAIILAGLLLFSLRGAPAGGPHSLNDIIGSGGHTSMVSPRSIVQGITAGSALAVIQLGVLVLILTPLMRVAMTVLLFTVLRDHRFTVITLIVLVVLVLGLIGVGS